MHTHLALELTPQSYMVVLADGHQLFHIVYFFACLYHSQGNHVQDACEALRVLNVQARKHVSKKGRQSRGSCAGCV